MKTKFLLIVFPLLLLLSALGIHLIEGTGNSSYASFFNSVWWTVVTFTTVGYGDMYPATEAGKLFGIFVLVTGVLINSVVISLVSNWFFAFQSGRQKGLTPIKTKDHILICSDNPEFIRSIIKEYELEQEFNVVLISPLPQSPLIGTKFEEIPWINGKSFHTDILKKASASEAQIAYISFQDDSQTVMTVMQLENLTQGRIVSMAQYSDKDYRTHMEHVGCDYALNTYDIYIPLMVQSFTDQGSPTWIRELVINHPNTPSIKKQLLDEKSASQTWIDYVLHTKKNTGSMPLALVNNQTRVHVNPPSNTVLKPGDHVLTLVPPSNRPSADSIKDAIRTSGLDEISRIGHILICSDELQFIKRLIMELEIAGIKEEIVVLSEHPEWVHSETRLNLRWVQASSFSEEGFKLAQAYQARIALIDHQEDSHTLMAVLRLERVTGGSIFTVASFREHGFNHRLMEVGCDFCISVDELVAPILKNNSIHFGIGDLVEHIISQDHNTESLCVRKLSAKWQTKTWIDAITELNRDYGFLPAGLIRKGEPMMLVNPQIDVPVAPGDFLLFLVRNDLETDLPIFEKTPWTFDQPTPTGDYQIPETITKLIEQAEQGIPNAQYNLGLSYAKGKGIPQDMNKAFEWFSKAATQGQAQAMYNLGVLYIQGEGTPINAKLGYEWIDRAASKGHLLAQRKIETLRELKSPWNEAGQQSPTAPNLALLGKLNEAQKTWFISAFIKMIMIDGKIDLYEKQYLRSIIENIGLADQRSKLENAVLLGNEIKLFPLDGLDKETQEMLLQELINVAIIDRNFSEDEKRLMKEIGQLLNASDELIAQMIQSGIQSVSQFGK
ncbi:MAG: SEL1-like repeat protein [SAR324 cluster bacterium]|nr:SEL1-like repeat protein [SAR324 cluster bacterium]